jgi:RNA polymerase sigma-70 factor (ECF subfamily)
VTLEAPGRPWFEPLVHALGRPAYHFAMAITRDSALAEDIVQEAFVRLWQSDRTPSELPTFRAWLYRTIRNLARDEQRRQRVRALLRFALPASPDPTLEAERRMGDRELTSALETLSSGERQALYLRFSEDLDFGEIARIMGNREGTARVFIHRALVKLRRRMIPSAPLEADA